MLIRGIVPSVAKVRRQRRHLRVSKLGIVSSGKKAGERAFWAACIARGMKELSGRREYGWDWSVGCGGRLRRAGQRGEAYSVWPCVLAWILDSFFVKACGIIEGFQQGLWLGPHFRSPFFWQQCEGRLE